MHGSHACSVSKFKGSSRLCFWQGAPIHCPDMCQRHPQASVLSAWQILRPSTRARHRSPSCPSACLQILREQQALLLEGSPTYLAAMSQEEPNANMKVDGLPPKRLEPALRPVGPNLAEWPEETDLQQVGTPPSWHSRCTAAAWAKRAACSRRQQARILQLCTGRVKCVFSRPSRGPHSCSTAEEHDNVSRLTSFQLPWHANEHCLCADQHTRQSATPQGSSSHLMPCSGTASWPRQTCPQRRTGLKWWALLPGGCRQLSCMCWLLLANSGILLWWVLLTGC